MIKLKEKHFISPTDFWTRNVSVNSGTKDKKAIFDSTNTILSKVDKVTAPNNIKVIFAGGIEKIKNAPFNIKSLASLRIVHKNFFLELSRNISSYGVISFPGKQADLDNKLHLITPGQKLKFHVMRDFYKNKV